MTILHTLKQRTGHRRRSNSRIRTGCVQFALAVGVLSLLALPAVTQPVAATPHNPVTLRVVTHRVLAHRAVTHRAVTHRQLRRLVVVSPSVTLSTTAAGASQVVYTVNFNASSTGAVVSGSGTIVLAAPAGTSWSADKDCCYSVTDNTTSTTGSTHTTGVAVSNSGTTVTLTSPIAIGNGDSVTVVASQATNTTTVGNNQDLAVSTSSDTATNALFNVTPAKGVVSPSVTLSTTAAGASQVVYTVNFNASSTGAVVSGSGTIVLAAPAGTSWSADKDCCYSVTDNTTSTTGSTHTTGVAVSNGGATVTLTSPIAIGNGDSVTVVASQATTTTTVGNNQDLAVSTSSDTATNALFNVTPAKGVVSPSVTLSTTAAGASQVVYTVNFNASSTGAVVSGSGTIVLAAPAGTSWSADKDCCYSVTDNTTSTTGSTHTTGVTVSNGGATVTLTSPIAIGNGDSVTVVASQATNTTTVGNNQDLAVSTSSDTATNALFNVTPAKGVVSPSVTLSTTAAGASQVVYTVNFNASSTGAVVSGSGTIVLAAPAGTSWSADKDCCYSVTDNTTSTTGSTHTTGVAVSNGGATVTLTSPIAIGNGDSVTVVASQATNTTTVGNNQDLAVSTSSDTATNALFDLVTGAKVSGQVTAGGAPQPGAPIQLCPTGGGACAQLTTDGGGNYAIVLADGTYTVTAFPPSGSSYGQVVDGPVTVAGTSPVVVTLALNPPVPLPAGASLTSNGFGTESGTVPVLNWSDQSTFSTTGCTNGTGFIEVLGTSTLDSHLTILLLPLQEVPAGSGNYSGAIPPLYPLHGNASLEFVITCPPPTDVLPYAGPTSGGNTATIHGTGFTNATGVTFGGAASPSIQVVSDTEITAVVPPGTGTVSVGVNDAHGPLPSDPLRSYTYLSVSGVSPPSGSASGGQTVTITGSGFTSAAGVVFGGTNLSPSFTVDSDTQITATVPSGTGTVDISVLTTGGASTVSPADTYTFTGSAQISKVNRARHRTHRTKVESRVTPTTEAQMSRVRRSIGRLQDIRRVTSGPVQTPASWLNAIQNAYSAGTEISSLSQAGPSPSLGAALNTVSGFLQTTLGTGLSMASGALQTPIITELNGGQALTGLPAAAFAAESQAVQMAVNSAIQNSTELQQQAVNQAVQAALAAAAVKSGHPNPSITRKPSGPNSNSGGSSVRIDPSGTVEDTNGNPISGASVTLLRSTNPAGPFTAPPNGSAIMDPSVNPETTSAEGQFHWDVYAGNYEVQASSSGCTDPNNSSSSEVTSSVFQIPPPALGIDLVLQCPGEPPPPRPSVTQVNGADGVATGGAAVTISGTGFGPTSTVAFGGANAPNLTYLSPTELIATSPPGSGTVDVTVTTGAQHSAITAADQYTYVALPVVSKVSPAIGPQSGDTHVLISGSGFTSVGLVSFGLQSAASFTVLSDQKILAVSPAGSGLVDIIVSGSGGTNATSARDEFRYTPPAVNAVTPSSGPNAGGTKVTITGTGFVHGAKVKFGTIRVKSVKVVNSTTITVVSPRVNHSGTVNVTVAVKKAISAISSNDQFTYSG